MSSKQPTGIPHRNPLDYTGPNKNIVPIEGFSRRPVPADKKFNIGQEVILGKNPSTGAAGELWYLARFEPNGDAEWQQITTGSAIADIDFLQTDDGAPPVGPNIGGVVDVLGGTGIITSGQDPSTAVTITVDSSVVGETITGDAGGPLNPLAGNWNIVGSTGVDTSGAGNTLTINLDGSTVGQTITGDAGGPLSPTAGNWNILGGTGVNTAGIGSTLTIDVDGNVVATQYDADSGSATPAAGILNLFGGNGTVTSGAGNTITAEMQSPFVGDFSFESNTGGLTETLTVQNTVDAASSAATLLSKVAGATSGNPLVQFEISGANTFSVGLDNSDSDFFKISQGAALGTNDTQIITSAGEVTFPLTPAFLATQTIAQSNVTGAGTLFTAIFDTEIFDQNSDFDPVTSVFTAPITGRYVLGFRLMFTNVSTTTAINWVLNTSNRNYNMKQSRGANEFTTAGGEFLSAGGSTLVDMDAGDTASVVPKAEGLAGDTIDTSGNPAQCFFSGYLQC
jgi:hypothetical protein